MTGGKRFKLNVPRDCIFHLFSMNVLIELLLGGGIDFGFVNGLLNVINAFLVAIRGFILFAIDLVRKINVTTRLEFELSSYDITVVHVCLYVTRTPATTDDRVNNEKYQSQINNNYHYKL